MTRSLFSLTVAAMTVASAQAFVAPSKTAVPSALAATSLAENSTLETNPRLSGLAFALDDGTRKSHSMAENTAFVQGFFKGISSPDSYRNLLTSLYYVYKAMEEDVLDTVEEDSILRRLDDAPLRRMKGLERDMEYFYGKDWRTTMMPPTPATQMYVNRIKEISNQDSDESTPSLSYLFIAHQYTRYLGDLFGGQMMGNMASRSMDLPSDGSGVSFYTFEGIDSTKDFITDWYTRLNALALTEQQKQAIVNEANLVFSLNISILEEVDGSPWAAVWTMVTSRVKEFTDWTNIKESKNQ